MSNTNTIAPELQLNVILDSALDAFKRAVLPLGLFSTVFRDVQLEGTDKIEVPYYPLQGINSQDFNGTYNFASGAGSRQEVREITVNRRKYQPISATSAQIARQPRLKLEEMGRLKGEKLAFDIVQDVLSVVTAANYGPAAFTGAANAFDSDDVVDLRVVANNNTSGPASVTDGVTTNGNATITSATARFNGNDIGSPISGTGIPAGAFIAGVTNATTATLSANASANGTGVTFTMTRPPMPWPEVGRALFVNPSYDGALLKDGNFRRDLTVAGQTTVNDGQFPNIYGFDYAYSAAIPTNGQNLVGMIAFKSAILAAFSPIAPAGNNVQYVARTDEDTGITIEFREWFDPDNDTLKRVIEANYGYAVGEALALRRLVSA